MVRRSSAPDDEAVAVLITAGQKLAAGAAAGGSSMSAHSGGRDFGGSGATCTRTVPLTPIGKEKMPWTSSVKIEPMVQIRRNEVASQLIVYSPPQMRCNSDSLERSPVNNIIEVTNFFVEIKLESELVCGALISLEDLNTYDETDPLQRQVRVSITSANSVIKIASCCKT